MNALIHSVCTHPCRVQRLLHRSIGFQIQLSPAKSTKAHVAGQLASRKEYQQRPRERDLLVVGCSGPGFPGGLQNPKEGMECKHAARGTAFPSNPARTKSHVPFPHPINKLIMVLKWSAQLHPFSQEQRHFLLSFQK